MTPGHPVIPPTYPEWHHQAACLQHPNPDLWFGHTPEDQAHARAICRGCPVATPCTLDALDREHGPAAHRFGIRAALDPTDRAELARWDRATLVTLLGQDGAA